MSFPRLVKRRKRARVMDEVEVVQYVKVGGGLPSSPPERFGVYQPGGRRSRKGKPRHPRAGRFGAGE